MLFTPAAQARAPGNYLFMNIGPKGDGSYSAAFPSEILKRGRESGMDKHGRPDSQA